MPTAEAALLKRPIALTGATGFIGRELQRQLLATGWPVRALLRPASRHRAHLLPGVDAVEVGLDDEAGLRAALDGVDAVISCAGAVRGARPADFAPANVHGVRNLVAAVGAQVVPPYLLHVSSLAATRPRLSDYAESKFLGEGEASRAPSPWTILRPPAVYGPGDREMLPMFRAMRAGIAPIVGPRGQRLSLLHVEDLGRAIILVLEHRINCAGRSFELDDGKAGGYDWDEMIAATRGRAPVLKLPVPRALLTALSRVNLALAAITGSAPMLTPGKVRELSEPAWLCDNSDLHAATGWSPRVPLQLGIERLFGGHSLS